MKILIVDDHKMFCDGLKLILSRLEEQTETIETGSGAEALRLAGQHSDLDLAMLDINLPDSDGVSLLQSFSKQYPTVPVIMLTATESRQMVQRCFDAGASGYITKSSGADLMLNAIRLVLAGGTYVPSFMVLHQEPATSRVKVPLDNDTLALLTARQAEVLTQLKDGISNKEIALRLGVSESTVKVHVSAILKTLGLRSRLEAALFAQQLSHGT